MQQKNLILFIAICVIIVIGWPMLMNQFVRKPPPKEGTQPTAKSPPLSVDRALALYSAAPSAAVPGLAANFALAFVASDAARLAARPRPEQVWRELSEPDKLRIAAVQTVAVPSITSFGLFEALTAPRAAAKAKPAAEPKTHILGGGSDNYLTVKLTDLGAGVQELILNKFEAATREGRPAGHELALIQDDPFRPSFLMYHYPDPEKAEPVDTLGKAIWEHKEGDSSHHVFSTTIDDLVITKTYRLAPRTYHLTVTLQIERKDRPGAKAGPVKFRYQFAGPHGMPIEGEWYTPTYRNPVMAIVDSSKDTLREDVEQGETQYRISHRKGGDKVPEALAPGSYIQYGGVAIQYFASVFAPDNQQPPPEQGGVDFKQILSYLRPTLETEEMRGKVFAVGRAELVLQPKLEAWDLRGEITKISLAADKPELVLSTGGKEDRTYTFRLLLGAREALQNEGLKVGTKVVVSYDTKGDERSAFDIRRENAPRTFRLLPRAVEQIGKENLDGVDVVVNYYRLEDGQLVAADIRKGKSLRPFTEDITVRAVSNTVELMPGKKVVHQFLLYNGPVKVSLLGQFTGDKAVDPSLVARYADDLHLNTLTDYRSAGFFGRVARTIQWTRLLITCTNVMHWLLDKLHAIVRDYGLSIILLTVMVRGLMFPISRKQAYLSIKMQELAPEMKKLQEKHKNDPQERNKAVMDLYRRHKVNPMGGCLPVLLQMPIFLGLYYALQESIHFRLAPFLWIQNLAAPDMLWRWGENIVIPIVSAISDPDNQGAIYYLGPYFNVLPVIAVGFMVMQQKMLTPPPQDEQQAFQQKLMKYMMIFFGVMFYKVAAGLCLYFIVSSLWGLAERKLLPKRPNLALAGASGVPPPKINEARRPALSGAKPAPTGRGKSRTGRKETKVETEGPVQKVKGWWAEVLKQARKK